MITESADLLAQLRPDGPDEMGRELAEGPRAVAQTLAGAHALREELAAARRDARRIVLVGTGASLAMAVASQAWFRSAASESAGEPPLVGVREASTAALGAPDGETFRPGDLAILISASGASPETLAAARLARAAGAIVLAVTAGADSPLATAAGLVLHTPSGPEGGAATKSELSALAALGAIAGVLQTDPGAVDELRAGLERVVGDTVGPIACGRVLAGARCAWVVGFGAAEGIARAGALLLHEKALLPAVATTPSEFRHGPIEAATPGDVILAVEIDEPDRARTAYLDRLGSELATLGIPLLMVGGPGAPVVRGPGASIPVALPGGPGAALEAALRLQQVGRYAAHVRGSYRDGFRILRGVVSAAGDLFDGS